MNRELFKLRPQMSFIQTNDGVPIHCDVHGTGPVNLFFLHGWGGGHGKSGVSATGYTIQHFAEDVLAVAHNVGAKKFIPVGFSIGGKLACYLAAKHPDRVSALILLAPTAPGKSPVDREAALQGIRQAGDWRQYETVFKNWFASGTSDEIVEACCQTIARTPLPALESTAELFLWTSLANAIGQLAQPALLAVGEHDPVYGMAYQQKEMLPFLNHATATTLPSGHFVPLEQPVRLAPTISKFISESAAGRAFAKTAG